MELEALQEIHSELRSAGAKLVITPELEGYTRALRKKLNLTFDILTDLHLTIAEQFWLVFMLADYCAIFTNRLVMAWTGSTTNRNSDCQSRPDT